MHNGESMKLLVVALGISTLLGACAKTEREYYESGKIKSAYIVKNGKKNGLMREYYENGKIHIETIYKDDLKNGYEKYYFVDGKIEKDANYILGKEEGVFHEYYTSGQLKSLITYKNGLKDGEASFYKEDGSVIISANFIPNLNNGDTIGKCGNVPLTTNDVNGFIKTNQLPSKCK